VPDIDMIKGNPIVWWGGAASLVFYLVVTLVYILRKRRGYLDWKRTHYSLKILTGTASEWDRFTFLAKVQTFGWILHFVPFMVMARVTYLHHYFPALYFAMIAFAALVNHLLIVSHSQLRWFVASPVRIADVKGCVWRRGFGGDGLLLLFRTRIVWL
jgi:dolichyl-phosphate-mannose-protein mannosyltransferase